MKELAPTRDLAQTCLLQRGVKNVDLTHKLVTLSRSTCLGQKEKQKEEASAVGVGHIFRNNIRNF